MRKFKEHHDNFRLGELTLPAENPFGQSCYDATWILSLALNQTITSTYTEHFCIIITFNCSFFNYILSSKHIYFLFVLIMYIIIIFIIM